MASTARSARRCGRCCPTSSARDAGRARGAVAPAAQPRHADGAAGPVADRHRAVGHGGAGRRTCRSISCSVAPAPRSCSYACTPLLADDQAYIDYVAARQRGGLQGRQVPLLVHARARPADVRGGRSAVSPARGIGAHARRRAALRSCRRAHGRRAGSARWDSAGSRRRCSTPTSRAIADPTSEHGADHRCRQHLARSADDRAGDPAAAPGARCGSTPRSAAASRRSARSWRWPRPTA